jgi:hypothetical protein
LFTTFAGEVTATLAAGTGATGLEATTTAIQTGLGAARVLLRRNVAEFAAEAGLALAHRHPTLLSVFKKYQNKSTIETKNI